LSLPIWTSGVSGREDELKATDEVAEEVGYQDDEDEAGGGGWDMQAEAAGDEDDLGILAEDDIEDW
jgi:hypothetical protein